MTPALRKILLEDAFNPYQLSGNAAVYSVDGGESDATYRTNGLGRVKLIADRSGNSAVNCLVLPAVVGNYASRADDPVLPRGSFWGYFDAELPNPVPAAEMVLMAQWDSVANQRAWYWYLDLGTGKLALGLSTDGVNPSYAVSSVAPTLSAFGRLRTAFFRNATTGDVTFYTSSDGVSYNQLGTVRPGPTGDLFDSSTALRIGQTVGGNPLAANVYSASLRSDPSTIITGVNFATFSKLAATGTGLAGETWTINTSGDLGARISGARDSVEFTATKIGLIATDAFGRNYLTTDGSNDYYKSAPFSLGQPTTVYFVGTQVSWTDTDAIFDGGSATTGKLYQRDASPTVKVTAGGSTADLGVGWAVGSRAVISVVFNGANSSGSINLGTIVTGSLGTASMNGFTLGTNGGASAEFSNVAFNEAIIRSAADPDWLQAKIKRFLMRKWAVAA